MLCIFFFSRDNELQTHHGNFLLMDNKHRKLFVIKQSKGCKFVPKMHQNRPTFGGLRPDQLRQHNALPKYPKPQRGPTSRGKEKRGGRGRKGRGPGYKGTEGRKEGTEREKNSRQSQGEYRINTCLYTHRIR